MAYANPEDQKRAQHESYLRNKEAVLERSKAWKRANREKINAGKRGMTVEEYRAWKADSEERSTRDRKAREERRVQEREERRSERAQRTRPRRPAKTERAVEPRRPQPSPTLGLSIEESVRRRLARQADPSARNPSTEENS